MDVVTIIRFRKNRLLNYDYECDCIYFMNQLIEHEVE